jgi:hypothetical protein
MPGMDNSPLFDSFNFLTIRGKETGFVAVSRLFYEYLRKDYNDAADRCHLGSCWLLNSVAAQYLAVKRGALESAKSSEVVSSSQSFFLIP